MLFRSVVAAALGCEQHCAPAGTGECAGHMVAQAAGGGARGGGAGPAAGLAKLGCATRWRRVARALLRGSVADRPLARLYSPPATTRQNAGRVALGSASLGLESDFTERRILPDPFTKTHILRAPEPPECVFP